MNAWILKPLPIASVTAPNTAVGYAPANLANDYAGVVWQSTGTSPQIVIDFGADVPIDTVLAFGLFIPGGVSGTSIYFATAAQGASFTGANTSSGVGAGNYWGAAFQTAGLNRLVNGLDIGLWSAPDAGGPPAAVRYMRLWFFDVPPGQGVQIGRVVAGKRMQLERNFAFGGAFGIRDFGSLELSNRAVLLRRRAPKRRTIGISFSSARKDEVEAAIMPLVEQLGGTDCVALVTDPAPDPMRARRCYFGPMTGELGAIWRNAAAWEWRVNLLSLF